MLNPPEAIVFIMNFLIWFWFYSLVEVHFSLQIHCCWGLLPRLAWYLSCLIYILIWYFYGRKWCRTSIQNILQYKKAMVSLAFFTCFYVNVLTNLLISQEHFILGCIIFSKDFSQKTDFQSAWALVCNFIWQSQ